MSDKGLVSKIYKVASVVSNSQRPYGLYPARLLCPWDAPGKSTGVGCHALLQGIFLTQGSNLCFLLLLHCRQIFFFFLMLSHQGSPAMGETYQKLTLIPKRSDYRFFFLLSLLFSDFQYAYVLLYQIHICFLPFIANIFKK